MTKIQKFIATAVLAVVLMLPLLGNVKSAYGNSFPITAPVTPPSQTQSPKPTLSPIPVTPPVNSTPKPTVKPRERKKFCYHKPVWIRWFKIKWVKVCLYR